MRPFLNGRPWRFGLARTLHLDGSRAVPVASDGCTNPRQAAPLAHQFGLPDFPGNTIGMSVAHAVALMGFA